MKKTLPLSTRLSDECLKSGVSRHIIEKDYALSWVLAGIAETPSLKDSLIFKGGTCLKKCYFGTYRYSEDLDFSAVGNFPVGAKLSDQMKLVAEKTESLLRDLIGDTRVICDQYTEKSPHPSLQEAFVFRLKLPYQKEPLVRVLVEVTTQEKIFTSPQEKKIIHGYEEEMLSTIQAYSLEEIIAEKACAILSNAKKLHEKTWVRSRARDYYDLWSVFNKFGEEIKHEQLLSLTQQKCSFRGQYFSKVEDFFEDHYVKEISRTWIEWLGPVVPDLPKSEVVLEELRPVFQKYLCPPSN